MPTYRYTCPDCGFRLELLQSHAEMEKLRGQLRCQQCEAPMEFCFPTPYLHTDTSFVANWGDGFGEGDAESLRRRRAYANAHRHGISPSGATYCPGLCAPGVPNDPKAWVPHDNAKAYIKKRCEELNYACEGAVTVKQREPDSDPFDRSYQVAPDIVKREVDRIVDRDHGGKIDGKKKAELTEATAERLKGNL